MADLRELKVEDEEESREKTMEQFSISFYYEPKSLKKKIQPPLFIVSKEMKYYIIKEN